jgi:hypothetical protein
METQQKTTDKEQKKVRRLFVRVPLILFLLLMLYLTSPFAAALAGRFGWRPNGRTQQALESAWLPIHWYIKSGMPGGATYKKTIDWFAA